MELACKHVDDWSTAHVDALSSSYGNFDRVVALGWLVADALGCPFLSRKDALKVGHAARQRAGKLATQRASTRRDAQRRIGRLAADDPARQTLAAEAEEAAVALLASPVSPALPLPDAPPTVCGKRARETSAPPTLVEQLRDDLKAAEKIEKRAKKKSDDDYAAQWEAFANGRYRCELMPKRDGSFGVVEAREERACADPARAGSCVRRVRRGRRGGRRSRRSERRGGRRSGRSERRGGRRSAHARTHGGRE